MGFFDIFSKKKPELSEEQLKWNKIWDLWAEGKAESPFSELMTYQSEINNGGHDQYFTNLQNTGDLRKEISVLEEVLSPMMLENFKKAYDAYLILEENEDNEEAEETLDECDSVFYKNEGEITRFLEKYSAEIKL